MGSNYDRKNLKWNGWGFANKDYALGDRAPAFWQFVATEVGLAEVAPRPPTPLEDVPLAAPALTDAARDALAEAVGREHVRQDRYERLFHAVGKSFRDLIRIRHGHVERAPDAVVYPRDEREVSAVLAAARRHDLAVVPYGGGSSVVGGVEAAPGAHGAIITLDTTRMRSLRALDPQSRTAVVEAGIYGPELEAELQSQGWTLGHYPQSFEFSTLGGWIAARGAGQQSDGYGAAAEWLVAAKTITPAGDLRTLPVPSSAAGPDLKHMIAGSEGMLGVITEATVRVRPLPPKQDFRAYLFRDFDSGAEAIRRMTQAEIPVSMIRLSDADETRFFTAFSEVGKPRKAARRVADRLLGLGGYASPCVMVVGVEGSTREVTRTVARTTAVCLAQRAIPLGTGVGQRWYENRFELPYLRDSMLDRGIGIDTLETATSWSGLHALHQAVGDRLRDALERDGGRAVVMCHISHSYEVGASLYFTFAWAMRPGHELEQWQEAKRAASDAIRDHGATISHHHGVGADHLPWLPAEKGELGMALLQGAKRAIDPDGIMNPGKLVPE